MGVRRDAHGHSLLFGNRQSVANCGSEGCSCTTKGIASDGFAQEPCERPRVIFPLHPRGIFMSVLISILITFLVVILVLYLIGMLPIDGRAKQIARIVVIIIGVVSLLRYLAVF